MYREIPIYRLEVEAGLSEAIRAKENCAIATHCPILLDDNVTATVRESDYFLKKYQSVASNDNQFDLHYIYTILATTGWNKNDDVFDNQEMWGARNTAEDKPFNKGHDPNNIIGHITGNAVVDENYNLIENYSQTDSLPDKFHILTSAVIYKHVSSRDEKLTLATQSLLEEIHEGKWFVSMEALFSDFDYALIDPNGQQTVVSRNEETAFLSKHLRSYGGAGEYQGNRVGRLMRNMTFSGKGLVENPGNPESIIFKEEDSLIFRGVAQSTPEISLLVTSSKGESSMSDNNEQVQSLKTQVTSLEVRLKELDEEKIKAQISAFEKACADKDAEITELKFQLNVANEAVETSNKSVEELDAAKAESEKRTAELNEKLSDIEAENLKTSRISTLVDKGVSKSDAETLVETFTGISDEQFESLVETQSKLTELSNAPFHYKDEKDEKDGKKKKKKDEEKDADAKAESTEAEEVAEAADEAEENEALESVEAEDAPVLAAHSEDESQAVVASLNDYFSEVLGGTNNDKSRKGEFNYGT